MAKKPTNYQGLPIVDATSPLEITITNNDVKKSRKNDPAHCAAALAAQREYHTDVRVFLSRTYVKKDKVWVRYMNPERVRREIISFDRGSSFEPGTYRAIPPTGTQKLGNWKPTGKKHTGKQPRQVHNRTARVREFDSSQFNEK